MKKFEQIAILVLMIILSAASFKRNLIWADETYLWGDVIKKSPRVSRGYNNLGSAFMKKDMYGAAIEELKIAVTLDPWMMEPHYNLAVSYVRVVKFDDAVPEFKEVLKINNFLRKGHYGFPVRIGNEFQSHANLGNIYNTKGAYSDAVFHYKEALMIAPKDTSILFNLAIAYKKTGRIKEAREEFEEILKLDPADEGAKWNLMTLGR